MLEDKSILNYGLGGEAGERRPWAPKAIATIRSLADTLEDRSIIVTMQRKKKSETVERLRRSDNDDFATCAGKRCVGAKTISRS